MTRKDARPAHPVEAVIERTIKSHAEAAKTRKEQDERMRLRPRARLAKALFEALKKELNTKELNGVNRSHEKLAELCEEHAKQIAKATGLEPHGKRD